MLEVGLQLDHNAPKFGPPYAASIKIMTSRLCEVLYDLQEAVTQELSQLGSARTEEIRDKFTTAFELLENSRPPEKITALVEELKAAAHAQQDLLLTARNGTPPTSRSTSDPREEAVSSDSSMDETERRVWAHIDEFAPKDIADVSTKKEDPQSRIERNEKGDWIEAMQNGSMFVRISKKGTFGRRQHIQRRRVKVALGNDLETLTVTEFSRHDEQHVKRQSYLYLSKITSFEYGVTSRAFRYLEALAESDVNRGVCLVNPAHLCFSLTSGRTTLDLVALDNCIIDPWVMGLNSLLPLFPGRIFLTYEEFQTKKQRLQMDMVLSREVRRRQVAEFRQRQSRDCP